MEEGDGERCGGEDCPHEIIGNCSVCPNSSASATTATTGVTYTCACGASFTIFNDYQAHLLYGGCPLRAEPIAQEGSPSPTTTTVSFAWSCGCGLTFDSYQAYVEHIPSCTYMWPVKQLAKDEDAGAGVSEKDIVGFVRGHIELIRKSLFEVERLLKHLER
jgi:hypothetical protein